jgi:hypothetical protein
MTTWLACRTLYYLMLLTQNYHLVGCLLISTMVLGNHEDVRRRPQVLRPDYLGIGSSQVRPSFSSRSSKDTIN